MKLPTLFLRDEYRRRCRWLVRRAPLQEAHRKVLAALDDKPKLSDADRQFVRAMFSIYKPGSVNEV